MNEIPNGNRHLLLYTLKWMSLYIAMGFIAAWLANVDLCKQNVNVKQRATASTVMATAPLL